MCQHLFNQLNIPKHNIHLPDGLASDIEAACLAYSNAIQTMGGMDLQLLGIGSNGHIGFNEPQTCFNSRTHVVELSEQTRIDNGRFFVEQSEVPTLAITMGIKDILEAKEIILVATGRNKTDIMAQLFSSEIDERLPASALKQHSNLTIVLDREAAALLPEQAFKNAV
jgi:glucosamine-6-phosphate deaminase